ncbi:low-affinity phosphate transporter [Aspergillus pseudoviridinutans]|uniref:Small ribosomal subunit protein uS7m n=1 Tax=Aspergillus pseudoviridinutans TaxID=1517512 RepID=A0A9P3B5V1_9EURO|nr:low-affinity phosphate transporter [Aspergillus pseudoviridinutans]GIJ84485.1 low-affinity phosphate transporter [Aspergillus pseudoviridinutans]
MPPRINLFTVGKALPAFRPSTSSAVSSRFSINRPHAASTVQAQRRWNSSKSEKEDELNGLKGPTEDPLPHVSEEAAQMDKILHGGKYEAAASPELEQGTPVAEILQRDKDALKHMPKVMQDQLKRSSGNRSFSTFTRRYQPDLQGQDLADPSAAVVANMINQVNQEVAELHPGLKFPAPESLPKTENFRERYDSLLEQFTKLLMRDGKLSKAQKNMSFILDHLRTAPPPQPHPKRPLLPGPPGPQLPLNPVLYLTLIVDSVAPLIKIRQQKGIAGGGAAVQIPVPLMQRQRRRTAIRWIIDASDKRRDSSFAQRVANELVAVAEGRSGVWDRREAVHKLGIAGRSNLGLVTQRRPSPNFGVFPFFFSKFPPVETVSSNAVGRTVARIASATGAYEDKHDGHDQGFELEDFHTRSRYPLVTRERTSSTHLLSTESDSHAQAEAQAEASEKYSQPGEKSGQGYRATYLRLRFWVEALRRRQAQASAKESAGEQRKAKMKFSHSIQFNAVPDWSAYYIAYSNLKKLIYSLEQHARRGNGQVQSDVESAPLLSETPSPEAVFRRALNAELEKICTFYEVKESEILKEVEDVVRDAEEYTSKTDGADVDPMSDAMIKSRRMSSSSHTRPRTGSSYRDLPSEESLDDDDGADSDDEHHPLAGHRTVPLTARSRSDVSDARFMADSTFLGFVRRGSAGHDEHFKDPRFLDLYNEGLSLKQRAVNVYVSLCGLKSYIQLNKTGFSKALKKFDKILDCNLRREYMSSTVSPAYPFTDSTMKKIEDVIARVEQLYADVITGGDLPLAKRELRLHLREHVVWERNTVWREMIGIERKAQAANVGIRRTLLGIDEDPAAARRQGDEQEAAAKEFDTPFGRYSVPEWLCSLSFGTLIVILTVFIVLLYAPIMDKPEQQNCLAMLVFVSLLWATEVIPLFVTSLLIPFLVVMLRIMKSAEKPYQRLGPKDATSAAFSAMWTPVIMLLLGGFTIAAALSKYDIARRMAMFVLSRAGSNPKVVLLTNMFVSMFLSMWISNVASPVLCYSIIQPLLRNLAPDSDFAKALVLGIALAANVGGAASPIASPQNIIALQNMYPSISWGTWFFVSLPVCIISILLIWLLLLATFPTRGTAIVPIRPVKDRFSGVQYFVTIVTLSTIGLWCASHQLEHVFGDMGVIAIIPMVLFFGTGILNKEDFNNFLWTIIILAAGGLCLGKAVTSSGLLHTIAKTITARVDHFSLYGVLIVFSALILVMATFISHTVAALIMLPLVRQIGVTMDDPHPNLLVMASALMCSVAMALPTSGFPNMTAIMTEVPQTGQRYLHVRHFFTRGIPASLISWAVIVTIGYGLMYIAGL